MTRRSRRKILRWSVFLLAALVLGAALAAGLALRASLPRLAGEVELAGLESPVTIERDALGIPVIRGSSRKDVAFATGFAHGQDRWFQMDLLRRSGAGELAALLGSALLPRDRRIRVHRFRRLAREVLAAIGPAERVLLEAYAAGVNAALADAAGKSFEYVLLGAEPEPWRAEDSLLVVYAQWIDLQGLDNAVERQNGRLAATLPEAVYGLLTAPDPTWEAPLDGSRIPEPRMPTAAEYDLRRLDPALFDHVDRLKAPERKTALGADPRGEAIGSNNWAIAAGRTAQRGALLANDMHLRLRVPNTWYRARLVVESAALDVSGVSLPGVPAIVAGSNGRVAWGFTNSYGDFQDLVEIEPAGDGSGGYLTATGTRRFETDIETLEVAGDEPEPLIVRRTIWGPVIGWNGQGKELALAWTAHHREATDLILLDLERARSLDEAASIIAGAGMPAQNVVLADRDGRIGWVLSGRLPARRGFDPSRPAAWHEQNVGWLGWLPRHEAPSLLDPPGGLAWSANSRVVGGEAYTRIGDGGFAPAARARQIRARLERLQSAVARDLLAVQLDIRADYLAEWQPIALAAFERAGNREAAALVARWSGSAAVDDAGYRLVREFERNAVERAFTMLTVEARSRWPGFAWLVPQRFTEVAWRLLRERPAHLLDPRFGGWDAWLADVAAATASSLPPACSELADCSWGKVNTAAIQHPISFAIPLLARWLDMPADPLPGDWSTPRVQSPGFGASERFVVSPGREAAGLMHSPGGQSGHPLSPYYRAGHAAWVDGDATPFLPGEPAEVLRLVPRGR
jgi:penicillin G amidase